MRQPDDLTGNRYGRLVVLKEDGYRFVAGSNKLYWLCKCDCGAKGAFMGGALRSGNTQSCGCLRIDRSKSGRQRSHGWSGTREYRIWAYMIQRCTNPKDHNYQNYGARGITVCDRWRDFRNFISDMGPCPDKSMSLDRIDNDKGYEPENCRWATAEEQSRNRRIVKRYKALDISGNIPEWAERLGCNEWEIRKRLQAGIPMEGIIEEFEPEDTFVPSL